MTQPRWATIEVSLKDPVTEEVALRQLCDRMEELAGLIADNDEVGGVETRDPFTFRSDDPSFGAPVTSPELTVYLEPHALEAQEQRVLRLGESMELRVHTRGSVHAGEEWRDVWKRYYRPLVLGEAQLLIRPSWEPRREGDPSLELVLDPGRAFGTGLHESTRLCLDLLCEQAGALRPRRALDLGCGSGILGLAALRLFPELSHLLFVDVDPQAHEVSEENAELNDLQHRSGFRTGTAQTLRAAATTEAFDLVFANIRPEVLIPGSEDIAALVAPDGWLMLSGILNEEAETVAQSYADRGLVEAHRKQLADWTALLYRRVDGAS